MCAPGTKFYGTLVVALYVPFLMIWRYACLQSYLMTPMIFNHTNFAQDLDVFSPTSLPMPTPLPFTWLDKQNCGTV